MLTEFHSNSPIMNKSDINNLIQNGNVQIPARISLLAKTIVLSKEDKTYTQVQLRRVVHADKLYDKYVSDTISLLKSINLYKPQVNLTKMPSFSFSMQFDFYLDKAHISQDDTDFYPIDNPLRKDKVFKIPFVAASSWKGNLRSALRLQKGWQDNCHEMKSLFGNEREADTGFMQGRLYFYPTFFDKMDLEVIAPLDRERRTPTPGPIYIECVPEGASGTFSFLYVPVDLIGAPELATETKRDLKVTIEAVKAMMLVYGFSAKKSSGYGVIKPDLRAGADGKYGKLWTNRQEIASLEWQSQEDGFLFTFKTLNELASAVHQEE